MSCELLQSGTNPSCPALAPMYAVPGQYNYANSFNAATGSSLISGSNIYAGPVYGNLGSAGFIDDYLFQIQPANVDVVSTTLSLGGAFSISNLFARVYSYTVPGNTNGLVTTKPAGTVQYGTISTSGSSTTVTINPFMLTAGSYVLEITGTTSGTQGGSYTGTLNLAPVPLPGALSLMLSGLVGLFALQLLRRRPQAAPALR